MERYATRRIEGYVTSDGSEIMLDIEKVRRLKAAAELLAKSVAQYDAMFPGDAFATVEVSAKVWARWVRLTMNVDEALSDLAEEG